MEDTEANNTDAGKSALEPLLREQFLEARGRKERWGAKITRKPASCQGACAVPKIPTFCHDHGITQQYIAQKTRMR